MNDATKYKLIFNGAGALVALTVGAYFVARVVSPSTAQPCSETYSTLMPLSLESTSGTLLSPIELEARIGGRETSSAAFAKVVTVAHKEVPAAFEISLPKGSLAPSANANTSGGLAFDWQPSGVSSAKSACLSYRVFLPEDFDFKRGGTLPGLFGAQAGDVGGKPAFSAHVMWRERGEGEIFAHLPTNKDKRAQSFDRGSFKFPVGTWVRIDQEIALNTPGAKDGAMRLWIDGALKIERKDVVFREQSDVVLGGARVDVHYGGTDASFAAPKATTVRLSAPEMRIN